MNCLYVHSGVPEEKLCSDLAVAVLAGGASRRFGADKALVKLCYDGRTLIERTVATGLAVSGAVFVVGHQRYATLLPKVPVVPDDYPNQGPLAGILTALRRSSARRVLILPSDAPCLSLPLLHWMRQIETATDVLVFRTNAGQWQPMPAIYSRSLIDRVEQMVASGERSISSILDRVSVQEISESAVRLHDPEMNSFFSLNSPSDLDRARRCASCN